MHNFGSSIVFSDTLRSCSTYLSLELMFKGFVIIGDQTTLSEWGRIVAELLVANSTSLLRWKRWTLGLLKVKFLRGLWSSLGHFLNDISKRVKDAKPSTSK